MQELRNKNFIDIPAAVLAALIVCCLARGLEAESAFPCVIHVHSTFSDNGRHSIEEIALKARERGIKVLILSDHDLMKWEYGIFPLRNIISRKVEKNSVLSIGAGAFLREIERVQKKFPDIIIVPGVESSPFYYWTGSPFRGNLTLNGWNKHILIAGMRNEDDYKNLPLVGNIPAYKIDFLKFWPALVIAAGFFAGIRKRAGIIFLILGFLSLLYNYPFMTFAFNQYDGGDAAIQSSSPAQRGGAGEMPYQNLIDYVNEKGGVTFWAHPEAPNFEKSVNFGKVSVKTPRYHESILNTINYTGFAYFWEGDEVIGKPGGYWDKTLVEYCEGKRGSPVWALAELDYTADGANSTWLGIAKNVLWLNKFNFDEVMSALKTGKFYALCKSREEDYEPALERYELIGNSVFISAGSSDGGSHGVNVRFVETGRTTKIEKGRTPFELRFEISSKKNGYCRVEIDMENGSKLVTNPLFFK